MDGELSIHRFNIKDYHRLGEVGVLTEDDNLELIEGKIIDMTPIGSKHASCVARLTNLLVRELRERAIVNPQNPIELTTDSEPEPDISILRNRSDFYKNAHPQPEDVLLIIEVADTSIEYDRTIKIPLYAKASIQEVWLINLSEELVDIYRSPSPRGYKLNLKAYRKEEVSPLCFSDIKIIVSEIIG